MRRLLDAFLVTMLWGGAALALTPAECDRTTHISHGGEADHVDLGEGRVMWIDWWSQEGTAEMLNVMDCDSGARLNARTREENMGAEGPLDRTDDALAIVARHESGSRVFATLNRMASDIEDVARDVRVATLTEETCACATFYPDLRGEKTKFVLR